MMTDENAISSELDPPSRRIGKAHSIVLLVLGAVVVATTLLLWFHPTLGYARGGILDGADLRWSLIQILWWCSLVFATTSTLVASLLASRVAAGTRSALAYGIAITMVAAALPLLDTYY